MNGKELKEGILYNQNIQMVFKDFIATIQGIL
jgi:hypothetical protein